jgi:hypothetical protein
LKKYPVFWLEDLKNRIDTHGDKILRKNKKIGCLTGININGNNLVT